MAHEKDIVVAPGKQTEYDNFHYAHAVRAGNLLFLSGQTGAQLDGSMPEGLTAQTEAAFATLDATLRSVGLTFDDLVSLTSYHVGDILESIWDFFTVKDDNVEAPYPAWTAVGVKDLAHEGALIEIAAIATFE